MTEALSNSGPALPPRPPGQLAPLTVLAQYLKDLSFESPNAAAMQGRGEEPHGSVNVDVRAKPANGGRFEVVLKLRVEANRQGQMAYLLELEYGGLFAVSAPEEAVERLLMVEAPRLLFPFARSIVAQASTDGGFTPLLISPVDFDAIYRSQRQARPAAGAPGPA